MLTVDIAMKVNPDPSQEPKSSAQSWWQTFPGVLTATAGVVTAVAGLIVALSQAGILPKAGEPAASHDTTANSSANSSANSNTSSNNTANEPAPQSSASVGQTSTAPTTTSNPADTPSGSLPSGMEVTVGDLVYRVLAANLVPFNAENKSLKLKIRGTNTNSRYDVVLGGSSLRLIVDGVPRAPSNNFYEVVSSQSAKEGEFDFEVPSSAGKVMLQISDESTGAMAQIPFDLGAVTP